MNQDYSSLSNAAGGAAVAAAVGVYYALILAFYVITVIIEWKVYVKAGQPGWAALIPIYNLYVLLKIVGRPTWWLVLYLIPGVNFIIMILVNIDLAKSFGKTAGFGIGLWLIAPVFLGILAFGDAEYAGPAAA